MLETNDACFSFVSNRKLEETMTELLCDIVTLIYATLPLVYIYLHKAAEIPKVNC